MKSLEMLTPTCRDVATIEPPWFSKSYVKGPMIENPIASAGLTCDGGEFEQVSIQVNVDPCAMEGKSDPCAVLTDGQVLVEADAQVWCVQLHWFGPWEGACATRIVLHKHCETGRWGAVLSEHVFTRALEVKGAAVKSVIVRVSKYGTHTWLWSYEKSNREDICSEIMTLYFK